MYKLVAFVFLAIVSFSSLEAGVIQGKNLYFEKLKESCGFTGDQMGIKKTTSEWKRLHKSGKLAYFLKEECPKSKIIIEKKELRDLYKFFVTFSKDSGNKPSCE